MTCLDGHDIFAVEPLVTLKVGQDRGQSDRTEDFEQSAWPLMQD